MTRYYSALLTFMFTLPILGLAFDWFSFEKGYAATIIASLGAAVVAYFLTPKRRSTKADFGQKLQ
ncbi:hypothetical protein [Corynebacterium pelargi]|uniref:Uncharacterized protein n=1 Tax=Corynebacterium pelargi TaxID=1471400 RepID=A0A410W6H8_9CORY|nr:hypothetical protein [Corynebacterium pelargi]QAU51562.1 hypothetical protein CPELA_01310 [Corynebacterium pelargi]GGG82371.1 hypothetical protein GCM10007338_21600 [Corynebacterium pelargi]